MAEHNQLGRKGEELAVEYLRLKEYEILQLNYRYQKAEVDILAKRGNLLIAAEVKTRSTPEFGNPQDFVKPKQIKQLVKAVNHFVEDEELDVEVRFDIIAIIKNKAGTKIEHIQDAFLYF
ncbi:YraN family protein [Christiangramia sp.]|uniref:YraN family protein n=1 Tax=Christiangramia sp. TaxID=1931228 RepID=UPI002605D618|nr:YraN family protein [Christiangramia sp.]